MKGFLLGQIGYLGDCLSVPFEYILMYTVLFGAPFYEGLVSSLDGVAVAVSAL